MTRCKNSGKCNVQPYMRCTACRYDKCVSVGMTKQKSKSRQEKEEDVDDVEILPDSDPQEAKPEAEPLVRTSKDTDRSQLGAYLKVEFGQNLHNISIQLKEHCSLPDKLRTIRRQDVQPHGPRQQGEARHASRTTRWAYDPQRIGRRPRRCEDGEWLG